MHADLINKVQETAVLHPVLTAPGADATSAAFDRSGDGPVFGNIWLGVPLDTLSGSIYWTLSLLECDESGGTYTAVSADDLIDANNVTAANALVVDANGEASRIYSFGYRGTKRYLKLKAAKTGTHTNGTPMCMWFTSEPLVLPAANRVSPA